MADPVAIRSTEILSDSYGTLTRTTFTQSRPDGSQQTLVRETYHRGDGATVLPFDPVRRTVLLVRQFRLAALRPGGDGQVVEAIAGLLDGGDPRATVEREALEEAGVRLTEPIELFTLLMSPGAFTERLTFFTATYAAADRVAPGGGLPDEGEDIAVLELDLDDALARVGTGAIDDAKTVILLQHLAQRPVPAPATTMPDPLAGLLPP